MNPKSYQSRVKQNNSTEFLGYAFHNIYNANGPQTPPDPKSDFFPDFLIVHYSDFIPIFHIPIFRSRCRLLAQEEWARRICSIRWQALSCGIPTSPGSSSGLLAKCWGLPLLLWNGPFQWGTGSGSKKINPKTHLWHIWPNNNIYFILEQKIRFNQISSRFS